VQFVEVHTRLIISAAIGIAAFGWWLGVDLWRGDSQKSSNRMFWLHVTAPMVAIVLLSASFVILAGPERF
jgi:hypothetical protein